MCHKGDSTPEPLLFEQTSDDVDCTDGRASYRTAAERRKKGVGITPPTFVWLPTGPCNKALCFERRHQKWTASLQHRSCVKVEVAVLGYRP